MNSLINSLTLHPLPPPLFVLSPQPSILLLCIICNNKEGFSLEYYALVVLFVFPVSTSLITKCFVFPSVDNDDHVWQSENVGHTAWYKFWYYIRLVNLSVLKSDFSWPQRLNRTPRAFENS